MKLARIAYLRPATEAELLQALAQYGPRAAILAGGQSLIPRLALRTQAADVLIDINRLAGEHGLGALPAPDAGLRIGPLARHRDIEQAPPAGAHVAMLAAAARHVGNPEVRNRGTFCGSIAYADPAAEFPLAAVALGARIELRSAGGRRHVAAEDFYTGPFATVRRADEFVAAVLVDDAGPDAFHFFDEVGRRPTAPAFASLALMAPDGKPPRLAVGGIVDRPRLLERTALVLAEQADDAAAVRAALQSELGDLLAGPDRAYHLHLAATLLERTRAAMLRHRAGKLS